MQDRVLNVLAQHAKKPGAPAPDESLFDAGILDSFALADFVEGIEKEFGLKVPDADVTPRKFETVEKIVAYLENQ